MPFVKPRTDAKRGNFCPVCGQPPIAYWTDQDGNEFWVHRIVETDAAPGQIIVYGCLIDDEVYRKWQESSDRTFAAIQADKAAKRRHASHPPDVHRRDMR